jgi:WD40 repeat protein
MVQAWDVTAKPAGPAVFPAASGQVLSDLFFTPAGDQFVTLSLDGTARIWNLESGREVARMTHSAQMIRTAFFDRPQARLVTVGGDQTLRFWGEIREREREMGLDRYKSLEALAWSGDSRFFASFSGEPGFPEKDGSLSVWEADRAVLARKLPTHQILDLRFSADGRDLLAVTRKGVSLWRDWRSSGSQLEKVHAFPESVAAAFNDEGTVLAIVHKGGKAGILRGPAWDREAPIPFHNPSRLGGTEPWPDDVAVSRSGRRVAIGLSGAIVLLDVERGRQEDPTVPVYFGPQRVAFSPDERTLGVAGSIRPKGRYRPPSPVLEIYEVESRVRILQELLPGDGPPSDVTFSRDGTRVAVAGPALTQVWKLPTSAEAAVLLSEVHPRSAHCRFAPAGDRLLTGVGRLVKLSLLHPDDLITEAVQRVGTARPER